jgi:hypothetical protein
MCFIHLEEVQQIEIVNHSLQRKINHTKVTKIL